MDQSTCGTGCLFVCLYFHTEKRGKEGLRGEERFRIGGLEGEETSGSKPGLRLYTRLEHIYRVRISHLLDSIHPVT